MSWVLNSDTAGTFRRVVVSEFQIGGATKLNEHSPRDIELRLGIFKSFSVGDRRVSESLIRAERSFGLVQFQVTTIHSEGIM